jgi:hypothetical protein
MKYKCMIQSVYIRMAWQRILPEVTVKGFKKCCVANVMDETGDNMLWNGSENYGNVRSECEEDEDMTVKMDTVTLIGKGR